MGISKTITPGADSCKMSLVLEEQFDFGLGLIQNIIENSTIRLFSTIILQQKNINSPASGVWTPTPIGNLYRGQLEVYIGTSRIFHDDGNGLILDEALATVGAVTNYATGALSINAGVYTPSTQHLFKFNMFRCEQKTSNGSGEISTTLATPPIARTSLMVYLPGGDRVAFDQAGVQTIIEDNSSGINGSIIYNDGTLILAGCQNNTVYNICYGNLRIIGQIFKAIESALIYRLAMKAKKIIHTSGSSQHHFRLINASVLTWENLWVADSFEVDSPDFQEYQSENYNGMVLQIDKDTLYVILMDWAEQDIFPASAKAAALEYSDQFTIGRATQPKKYQVQHINVPGNSSSLNASLPTNIKKGTLKIYLGNQQIGHDDNDNGDILPDNFAGTQNILTKQTEYSKNIYLKAIIDQTSIIINDADGLAGTEDGDGTIDGIENPGQSMETVTGPAEFSKSLTNIARPKTDGSFIVKIGSTTVGTVANVATTIVGIEELGLSGNFTTGAAETSKTINLGALKTDTGVTPNRYKFNLYIAGTFVGESFSSGAPSGKVLLFNAADQLNSIFNEDNFVASGATKSASLIHGGAGVFDGVGYWVSGQIMRFYQWDSGSETWLCVALARTDGVIYGNGYPIAGTVNTSTGAYNITAGLVTGKTYCVRYAYFAGAISASGQIVISSGLHSSQQYDYTWDYKGLAGTFAPAQNLCTLNQLKANKTYKIEWTYLGLAGTINYNTGALNLSAGIRGGQLYEIAYTSAGVSGTINYATGALALSGFTLASGSSGCAFTCYFETETPTTGGTYFTLNWTPNKSGTLSRVRIPVKPIGTPPNIKMIVTQGLNTWTSDNTPATGEEEDIEFLFLSAGAEPLAGGIPATFKSLLDSGNGDDANYYQAGVQAIVGGMGSNVIVSNSIGNEQPLGLVDIFKPGSGPDMFVNAQAYTLPKAIGANLLDYPGAKSKLNDQPDSIWNGPGFLKSIIMPIYQPGASAPALTLYIVIGSDSYSISLSGLTQGFNHKKADINAYNFNSDSIKKPEIYIAGSAGTNVEYFPVSWQTLSAWINQVYTSAWVNQTFVPKAWLSFIMSFESFYKTAPSVFLNDTINDESTEVSIATGNPYPNGQLVALDGGGNIYYWNFTQMDAYFKIWGW
jgi:hypothetical protein